MLIMTWGFCLHNAHAEDDLYLPRSYLEIIPELRLVPFNNDTGKKVQTLEFTINAGLDWQRWRYVSIHALIQAGCIIGIDDSFHSYTLNKNVSQRALPIIGLHAIVDIHPKNRIVALNLAIRASSAMTFKHVGIFTCETGLGLSARPFLKPKPEPLKTISFGIMTWFPVWDDYHSVFALDRNWFNISLQTAFEF